MPRRSADRVSWPMSAVLVLVLSPLVGVALAAITLRVMEAGR